MATIQDRVLNILKTPATEWPVIAAEATDVGRLYKEYIMPLSAIPVVASFIGMTFIGVTLPFTGGHLRYPMARGLSLLVVSYVFGLIGTYLCALVIEWLAPKFKSSGTRLDALKLVAYAMTPVWLAGVFQAIPMLGILGLVGLLYAIYLFYLGLPHLMKTPADQVVIYMIVSFVVMVVVSIVFGMIAAALTIGSTLAYVR